MHFTLIETDDPRWNSLIERVEHDVYHHPWYTMLLAEERSVQGCACYAKSGESEFLVPLLLGALPDYLDLNPDLRDAHSPGGYPSPLFVGDSDEIPSFVDQLAPFLRSERVITCFLRSNPYVGLALEHFSRAGILAERGRTVSISLDRPYEEILSEMRQGHRYEIRKTRSLGFQLVVDSWSHLPAFVELYQQLMNRLQASRSYRFSPQYFESMHSDSQGSMHLGTVLSPAGEVAAAALFSLSSGIVQYQFAATDPKFEDHAPQKMLIDGLIRFGLERGAKYVHLGGGVGAAEDSLLHFKMGFGGTTGTYHTMHLVADPEITRQAMDRWRELNPGISPGEDFFPSYRSPGQSTKL